VADHRDDLVVDESLCSLRPDSRVTRVILRVEFQLYFLTIDEKSCTIDFLYGKASAVFQILAHVCGGACQRSDVPDFHDGFVLRDRAGCRAKRCESEDGKGEDVSQVHFLFLLNN
jgi:hypothetical protein